MGLTDLARAQLKKRWGTMQKVLSSHSQVKDKFIHDPEQMKLLIVVDKLLTGWDGSSGSARSSRSSRGSRPARC